MGKYKYYYLHPVKAALAKRKRILHHVAILGTPLLFLAVVLTGGILAPHSYAASYTWDGGGATNNWSDCDNWSSNICPVAADSVTFNATSTKDSVIDAGFSGTVLSMGSASAYTGTITFSRDLTVGAFGLAGGTVNLGSQTIRSSGAFSLGSGLVFNAGTGTVIFTGSTATITCNNAVFNRVEFQNTGTKTVSDGCNLPLGANPTITHNLILSGILSGSGTFSTTTGTLTLQSTAALSGFSGFSAPGTHLTINGANLDFSAYTSFVLAGIYTQTGGVVLLPNGADLNSGFVLNTGSTFTAPAGTMSVAGNFTINSGVTFNANGGTIEFDGAGNLTCSGATFNLVRFTYAGSSVKTINDGCNLPLGLNPTVASRLTFAGTLSGTGVLTFAGVNNIIQSTGAFAGFTGFAGTLAIQGANVNFGDYTLVDFTVFTMASGSFTAPSDLMTVSSTFTISGGTFNANGGTVNFDNTTATITCNNATFHLVSFANNVSGTKTVGADCSLPLGDDPEIRSIILNGTLTGSGTFNTTVNLTLNSGGVLNGFSGLIVAGVFTNAGAVADFGSYSMVDFNGAFTLSSGTFVAPTGTATFAAAFTINSGATFTANGGTVVFDGSTATISCNNANFYLVILQNTGTKTVSSDCNLPLGNSPTITAGVTLSGTLSGSGIITQTLGTLTLNSGYALNGFTGMDGRALTINTNADFSVYSPFIIGSVFILNSGGTFVAPAGEARFDANFTINPGAVFSHNNGTTIFGGSTATISCNNAVFHLVQFTHTVGNKNISSNCTLPLGNNPSAMGTSVIILNGYFTGSGKLYKENGSITLNNPNALNMFSELDLFSLTVNADQDLSQFAPLYLRGLYQQNSGTVIAPTNMRVGAVASSFLLSGGTFVAPSDTLIVTNNISVSGGTFMHNNGTVQLFRAASPKTQNIEGDITFFNLTKQAIGLDDGVAFSPNSTTKVLGTLTLRGSTSYLMPLVSTTPGTPWNINMQGTTNICYVSVTDSNSIGNAVVAYQSTSNSANPGWVFLNAACPGSGGGGGGTGGEPTSTVTNYTQAQAAATAATLTTPTTTLPPYHGLPSTLAKTVDTIPGSREALRAFLRFVGVTALVMLLAGSIFWFVATKRKHDQDEDTFDVSHWQGTRVG